VHELEDQVHHLREQLDTLEPQRPEDEHDSLNYHLVVRAEARVVQDQNQLRHLLRVQGAQGHNQTT
jgi:hypothetical protein